MVWGAGDPNDYEKHVAALQAALDAERELADELAEALEKPGATILVAIDHYREARRQETT